MTEEQIFSKQNYTEKPLATGEYEYCSFINCDFSNSDLSDVKFLECRFEGCNLSMAKMRKTSMRDIHFNACKMLGFRFDECHPFGFSVSFDNCVLNHSSFYGVKLMKTSVKQCSLHEVDFTGANLTASLFSKCDFARSVFNNTILEKADLRTSYNYAIDPEKNRIKKAKFSIHGIAGLLHKYDISIDETM